MKYYRIDLNEDKYSVVGLPIKSTKKFIIPRFVENVFIDSIGTTKIKIEKNDNIYNIICINLEDTITGKMKVFSQEFLDYAKEINIETLLDEKILIYKYCRFYRVGDWRFDGDNGQEIIQYKAKIENLTQDKFK